MNPRSENPNINNNNRKGNLLAASGNRFNINKRFIIIEELFIYYIL